MLFVWIIGVLIQKIYKNRKLEIAVLSDQAKLERGEKSKMAEKQNI